MADEITLSGSLVYSDSEGTDVSLAVADLLQSITDKAVVRQKVGLTTTQQAIDLGNLATLGWAVFLNRSETITIKLRTAVAGEFFATLPPGGFAVLYLGSDITAPYAVSVTSPAQLEYLICAQ